MYLCEMNKTLMIGTLLGPCQLYPDEPILFSLWSRNGKCIKYIVPKSTVYVFLQFPVSRYYGPHQARGITLDTAFFVPDSMTFVIIFSSTLIALYYAFMSSSTTARG